MSLTIGLFTEVSDSKSHCLVVYSVCCSVETTVHEKWLPAETVRVILLSAEILCRMQNNTDSLDRKPFIKYSSLGREQDVANNLGGRQICWSNLGNKGKWRTSLYSVFLEIPRKQIKSNVDFKHHLSGTYP